MQMGALKSRPTIEVFRLRSAGILCKCSVSNGAFCKCMNNLKISAGIVEQNSLQTHCQLFFVIEGLDNDKLGIVFVCT